MKKTVCIIQPRLPAYRVPVFEALRDSLSAQEIGLGLVYSKAAGAEALRKDEGDLDWATVVPNRRWSLGDIELSWQPALRHAAAADLIIVPHENRFLLNYLLLLRKPFTGQKLAFWGHGANMHHLNSPRIRDRWKSVLLKLPDWWFGYTNLSRDILIQSGFSGEKITVVQNAVDTGDVRRCAAQVTEDDLKALRKKLRLSGRHVGVFCGSLYPGKRIDIVVAAAKQVRKRIRDFELVIIGTGPEEAVAVEASRQDSWIHFAGRRQGYEKVLYMKLGQLLFLPYIVGLAILDAFALGIPLLTMDNGSHSVEIAYLRNSINGIMTNNTVDAFADAAVALLNDPAKMKAMSGQCLSDSETYTVAKMVENFTEGIASCLAGA